MLQDDSEKVLLLLETAKLKFESIISNIRSLDIKASIILALYGVLLIPALDILAWEIQNKEVVFLKFLPLVVDSCGIILCILTLFPQNVTSFPNLLELENYYYGDLESDNLRLELYAYYRDNIEENRAITILKLTFIKCALWSASTAFIITIVLFLLKGEIIG
jgi:hypothetical protein